MQIPKSGDLISIDREVDAVIITRKNKNLNQKFSWSLIKVEPDQNGLVLESYDPKALSKTGAARAIDEALRGGQESMARRLSPKKRLPYSQVPEGIKILVVIIGTNIVEMVFDPDLISILSI